MSHVTLLSGWSRGPGYSSPKRRLVLRLRVAILSWAGSSPGTETGQRAKSFALHLLPTLCSCPVCLCPVPIPMSKDALVYPPMGLKGISRQS